MKTQIKNLIFLCFLLISSNIHAQLEVFENVHEISRKSMKGYLGGVETNEEAMTFDMIYVLPSSNRKVKLETYTFDEQLQLINTVKEEEDIEKVRTRYKWFNFRGDEFTRNLLTASITMGGKLVFRKKEVTYRYSWWFGRYNKSVKTLDKVKPTGDAGEKYIFRGGAYEVDLDETVLVFAGVQEKKNDNIGSTMNYELIKCDKDVNVTVLEKVTFDAPHQPIFAEPILDDENILNEDMPRDWVVVFAPIGGASVKGAKLSSKTNEYVYFRISPKGEIKEKLTINAPSNGWRVLQAYEKDGSVYLYGPTLTKDVNDKYIDQVFKTGLVATTSADSEEKVESNKSSGAFSGFKNMANTFSGNQDMGTTQEAIDAMLDELKFTGFSIGKITAGKTSFITDTPIADFNSKSVTPKGQKKALDFDGKRFQTYSINIVSNGDIMINGQDFKVGKSVIGSSGSDGARLYRGVYLFQFDEQGNLKHNYGIQLDQKERAGFFNKSPLTSDMFSAESTIYESPDKTKAYWFLHTCRAIEDVTDVDNNFFSKTITKTWSPLYTFQYGTIDLTNGTAGEFNILGESEKKNYYLMPSNYANEMGKYLVVLSETERGSRILQSRIDISK
ncbi:MAG: hypothetical protein R2730_04480 [Chitinophagales bacterium]